MKNSEDKQTFLIIPSYILQDKDLNPTDKIVMAEIDYLDKLKPTPGCWEKNIEMAKFLGVCADTITNSIKRLHALGRIRYAKVDNHRYIYSSYSRKISESKALKISDTQSEDIRVEQPKRKISDRKISDTQSEDIRASNRKISEPSRKISESDSEDTLSIDHIDHTRSEKDKTEKTNNTIFGSLSKRKKEDVELTFDFWNSFKSSGKWQSHRKLNKDMVVAVSLNMEHYSVEEICGAIQNYAKVLQGDKYYWDYVWPLSIFLTVKEGKNRDAPKKWWRFLEENFVEESYLIRHGKTSASRQETLLDDPNPKLTAKFEKAHRVFNGRRWKPTIGEKNKLIQAAIRTVKTVPNIGKEWIQDYLLENLTDALKQYYHDKGNVVQVGCWASDFTWNTLLPQLLGAMGINDENLFNFPDEKPSAIDFEVEVIPDGD